MASHSRWKRTVVHHVSAQQVIVEYPNSVKISYHEEKQGAVLILRIHAKPLPREQK